MLPTVLQQIDHGECLNQGFSQAKWTERQNTKKDGKQSHLGHITGESHHQILDSRRPGFWLPLMIDPRQIRPR